MMDCKKLREVLDAYVDRELSADAAAQAEGHIAECGACRRAAEGLTRLREAVKAAAGKPEAPLQLMERVRGSVSPRWHRAAAIQAIAATLILAGVLTLFVPGVRGAAATALDFLSLKLDDNRQLVLEGKLICRDCQLEKEYGYHAMCPLTGHHGWLATSDGRLWSILEGKVSEELIHNSSLLGRRVRIRGRIMRKAGSIEVSDYQLL
jgi:anti-sigma factor (TIGR02949 family)